MYKIFEDGVSEIQTDMISICLEYCMKEASKIYIYCSLENRAFTSNYFFEVNGKLYKKHKLKDVIPNINVSTDIQEQVLGILINDLVEFDKLCSEFDQPLPTEIRLIYDIENNNASAKYRYDVIHSDHKTLTENDVMQQWFNEIETQL